MVKRGWEEGGEYLIFGMLAGMLAVAVTVLWLSAPLERLLGPNMYAVRGAFHGLFAGIFMVTVTVGLYQALRLWTPAQINPLEFEAGSLINAAACALTIVFGNWLYIPYRAAGGPRSHFLETTPEVHKIFFEFKEFTALFTLPLAVCAAFLIFRYKSRLNESRPLRNTTALLLMLTFFYFVVAFGLGAAITKLKSV